MVGKNRNPGYLIAVVSAVFLSTTGIFIAYLSREFALPSLVLSFWREFFVFLILFLFLCIKSSQSIHVTGKVAGFYILYGFILAAFNALWTLSVAMNGAGLATFLAYTSPVFTALLGRLFLKDILNGFQWFCIALSLVGCLLISGFLGNSSAPINPIGFGLGLLSGLAFAFYTIQGRVASGRSDTADVWHSLCWVFGTASVFMLLFNFFLNGRSLSGINVSGDLFHLKNSVKGWSILLILAGLPTLTGYGLYNMSLKFLPPLTVSLIASSEPVFTAVLAYLILQEEMSLSAGCGGLLILMAVVLIQTGIPGFPKVEAES